jgi:hypothetical protein
MRRPIRILTTGVLLAALSTLILERAGVDRFRCACSPDCWCKKPGLNLFRWITPGTWHSIPIELSKVN